MFLVIVDLSQKLVVHNKILLQQLYWINKGEKEMKTTSLDKQGGKRNENNNNKKRQIIIIGMQSLFGFSERQWGGKINLKNCL